MLIPLRDNFTTLRVTNSSAVIPFCCFLFGYPWGTFILVLLQWYHLSIVRNSWCYMGHSFNRSVESRYHFTFFLHIVWSIRLGYYETSFYWTFTWNMSKISHSDRSHFPWCSITWDWFCLLRFKCAYDQSDLILPLLRTNPLASHQRVEIRIMSGCWTIIPSLCSTHLFINSIASLRRVNFPSS